MLFVKKWGNVLHEPAKTFLGDITLYDGSCNDHTQNGGGTQERLPDRAGGSQHPADT